MESLKRLVALEGYVHNLGFKWPDAITIVDQAISECEEIRGEIVNGATKERLQEEIGDLLHTAISLCNFAGFDAEETLDKVLDKFSGRIAALEETYKLAGFDDLNGQPMETLLQLWQEAKQRAALKKE